MKKSVKNLWVKALKSGKYKQTTGTLKDNYGFCCLGVLCDVYAKTNKKKVWSDGDFGFTAFGRRSALPSKVVKWAGLESDNPEVKYGKRKFKTNLAILNDEYRCSFKKIADVIERKL